MGQEDGRRYSAYPDSFQELVDAWQEFLSVLFVETPEAVEITDIQIHENIPKGTGIGTRFMNQAKGYCDQHGKRLIVSRVKNINFFGQLGFMNYSPKINDDPQFIYDPNSSVTSAVIPHQDHQTECPVCHNSMINGHCNQCEWSNLNPNIDSDPLSNPPDPTKDLHRGIQAATIPSHRWKWLPAVYAYEDPSSWE